MNDSFAVGMFVALLAFILLLGVFCFGGAVAISNTGSTCHDFGKVKLNGVWYECRATK